QLFQEFLRRAPSAAEITTYSAILKQADGNGETAVIVSLLSKLTLPGTTTLEYYKNIGGNNNQTWLNQVYEDLLGHGDVGDPTASIYLQEMIVNGDSPATIVGRIVATPEFQRDQIARLANLYGGGVYSY